MLSGFLLGVTITILIGLAFYLGHKLGESDVLPNQNVEEIEFEKMIKRREQGFQNILNYDVSVAMGKEVGDE